MRLPNVTLAQWSKRYEQPHNEHVKAFYKDILAHELQELEDIGKILLPKDTWYDLVDMCWDALRELELEEPLP